MSYEPKDFLCDRCLAIMRHAQAGHDALIGEYCDRCVDKLIAWILGDDLPSSLVRVNRP